MIACSTGSPASRRLLEIDAFDDAAVLHVQAGDDADLQHQRSPFAMAAMFIKVRPQTASAGTAVVLAQGFRLQQHVQRSASLSLHSSDWPGP